MGYLPGKSLHQLTFFSIRVRFRTAHPSRVLENHSHSGVSGIDPVPDFIPFDRAWCEKTPFDRFEQGRFPGSVFSKDRDHRLFARSESVGTG